MSTHSITSNTVKLTNLPNGVKTPNKWKIPLLTTAAVISGIATSLFLAMTLLSFGGMIGSICSGLGSPGALPCAFAMILFLGLSGGAGMLTTYLISEIKLAKNSQ